MINENRDSYVAYRLEKAKETYDDAILLIKNEKWTSDVNRLYYTCYYAVSALLLSKDIITKTHSGIKSQFFLHFVKNGDIPIEMGKLYSDLFDWRHKGDYGDFFDFKKEEVKPLAQPVKNFLNLIINLTKKQN
jgi:uncharacterized protein (UPF0332 family)